ncbi:tRNA guanosine(15) transglycosylase TgtA [Methanosphaera sp. ISO3-F5]|uniref:tRNA guanosine(15) transglycosylase TgtA n=1 Tax=Methanosphaera sp. ISO3-F5 TaxID=1452353 RepID=UPI002B263C05|nr:tRNA guanosine(15) transglycosylase TgtA [Methanosphaera sp. ISO3-F5]WQH63464.1 tRNA guanosine(15) transglycosylase TgtA [Methanosphaera sp. ISO3-F5]
MDFEIRYKDAMARIGTFETPHGTVTTPNLMPVVHPGKQTLDVKQFGAEIVITNSYIIYKNEHLKEKALKDGVHSLIDFPGTIETDSGSFQLSVYGDIDINNEEVIKFQEAIGTDIGTSLDIPTAPYVKREEAEEDLKITIERAEEASKVRKKLLLNSVVQGSTYPDLREYCAKEISKYDADIYPIGAVVPLMEMYRYADLVDAVMYSMRGLPENKPRHLMGAGHPMVFALAVAMGCDLFDSAAYILYANKDRFMMPDGTLKLENLIEMPCSCRVCTEHTPDQLRQMPQEQRAKLIAEHNLHISFAEIRRIRQAIVDGELMKLVETRCRSHPFLLDGLRRLQEYTDDMEKLNPSSKKSAFFYTGYESLSRSEVQRHKEKLENITPKNKNLIILPSTSKPYSKHANKEYIKKYTPKIPTFYSKTTNTDYTESDIVIADIPFGIIPLGLDEFYPLAQNESPTNTDENSKKYIQQAINEYSQKYENILIHRKVVGKYDLTDYKLIEEELKLPEAKVTDFDRLKTIADYQFGKGSGDALFGDNPEKIKIEKSKKTGKIRHVYQDDDIIVNMRANDGFLILSDLGAIRLHKHLPSPNLRVVVSEDSEPYALKGKSVFNKFVIDCDEKIRRNDEVLIVNKDDKLLACGKSLLSSYEIKDFNTGQAIKTRKIKKLTG